MFIQLDYGIHAKIYKRLGISFSFNAYFDLSLLHEQRKLLKIDGRV